MRVLARRVERERVGSTIVVANRRPRLHRVRNQAVVDEIELGHVRRRGERRVGRRLVADVPIEDRVVRRGIMDLRLAGTGGLGQIDHGGQFGVVDLDLFRRVPRLNVSVGDDDRDMVADIAHLALGERRMGAGLHRRAVLRMNHPAAGEAADLVGRDVVAGEDRDGARRLPRLGRIDLVDRRMGVRRAQEIGVGLAGTVDVVEVMALAGDEADVLFALDRSADACRAHDVSLPWNGLSAAVIRRPWPSSSRPFRGRPA